MQLRDGLQVIGPAFLVAVAYLDPGNWATAIESGSRFGYDQLWILVLSNLIAIHLQALSSRLGLASGKHLAQVCRDSYPPAVCRLLWLMTEASIVALDLTMVLGTAIGLNLLFKIPPVTCILLTALDALALFLLFPQTALRQAEQWTAVLVFSVLACFVIDLFISKPPLRSVLSGLTPTLHRDDIYSAVSLLGANVMPHNFYLHSALVAGQSSRNDNVTARRCYLNSLDIACALGLALLVNVAVLLVAASTFHSAGVKVATLQEAHDLLEQILNSRTAPLAFGLALLLTGQMSTFTSTIAGQVVMSGFVGLTTSPLARRLTTRALAIVPALCVQLVYGAEGSMKDDLSDMLMLLDTILQLLCQGPAAAHLSVKIEYAKPVLSCITRFLCRMLVIAQVVLAMQLPFTLIPLIKSTSSRAIMGVFASSWLRSMIAWAASFIVFTANLLMLVDMLWMESPEQIAAREEEQGFADKGFDEWLAQVMDVMTRSPWQFLSTCTVAIVAMMAMALLTWMGVHPVRVHGSLRARKVTSSGDLGGDDVDIETGVNHEDLRSGTLCQEHSTCDGSPPAVSFVNRLFADLPMQHVRRLWAALHSDRQPHPLQPPLTQALLQQHTLSSDPAALAWQLQHGMQVSELHVPRPLLDWRSQQERQQLWQRACDDMRSLAPSECSLPTLDGMQSLQSIQTAATTASEPGGGKGHRMGRGSRRKLAVLVCAIWKQHWDTHGQPVRRGPSRNDGGAVEAAEPILLSSARETLVELCDAVVEVLRISGVDSLLQHGVTHGSLAAMPGHRGSQGDTSGGMKAEQMAQLGPRLAACAAVARALWYNAAPLREAAVTAQEDVELQDLPQSCADSWTTVMKALAEVWPHILQRKDVDSENMCSDCITMPRAGVARPSVQHQVSENASRIEHKNIMSSWGATVGAQCVDQTSENADFAFLLSGTCFPRLCFMGFCMWCLATLLQLASVEPRPELWGKYVAALNHLQGPLFVTLNLAAALQGSAWLPTGQDGSWRAASLSEYGLTGITQSVQDRVLLSLDGIHEELRQLLQQVEAHIDTCGASHDSDRTAVAFAKGKFNIVSLIKRLRSHLTRRESYVPGGGPPLVGHQSAIGGTWHSRADAPWRPRQGHMRTAERQSRRADRLGPSSGSWRSKAHPADHDRHAFK